MFAESRVHDRRTFSLLAIPRRSESSSPPPHSGQSSTRLLSGRLWREGADQLVIGLASVVDRFDRPKLPIGFGPTVRKGQQVAARINGTERTPGHCDNLARREGSAKLIIVLSPISAWSL